MKLSIHLVNYNNAKYVPYCLKSLMEQNFKDFSVLIIDNHSQDRSVEIIEDYLKNPEHKFLKEKTIIVKNSKNYGFAGAHNQAIQWTKSEYVFMMNPDVIIDKNYLKILVEFLDQRDDAGSAQGALYKWNFSQFANEPQTIYTTLIDSLGLKIFPNHKVIELTDRKLIDQGPREIFGVSGALPVYRRLALEKVKIPICHKPFALYKNDQSSQQLYEYLDNDFFCYKEDVDLAYRLRLCCYKAYLIPQATALHDRTAAACASVVKNRKNKSNFINYHSYKNHIYFLIKNVPGKIFWKNGLKIIGYELSKFLYLLIFEPKTLKAVKEIIIHLPCMIRKRRYIKKITAKNGPFYLYS